jgi:hypothetical protein
LKLDNRNEIGVDKKVKNKRETHEELKLKPKIKEVPVITLIGSTTLVIMQSSGVAIHVDISKNRKN